MKTSDCWTTAYEFIASGETQNAVAFCEQTPCSGSVECQRFLGRTYYDQNDMEKAVNWFSKAAEQGDAIALFGLGSILFVQKDFRAALPYYERAAEKGYSRAYNWIAYIYQEGLDVPRNVELAVSNYKKGAAHGYLVAERALIRFTFQQGTIVNKILAVPKFIYILIKSAVLAYRNINDERIRDVPNAFTKKR